MTEEEIERLDTMARRNAELRTEIERLRGIEQFVTEASRHELDGLRAEIERLNKQESELATTLRQQDFEIKRLRAALDRAADALEFYDNKAESLKARAALKDTKP